VGRPSSRVRHPKRHSAASTPRSRRRFNDRLPDSSPRVYCVLIRPFERIGVIATPSARTTPAASTTFNSFVPII
jgi:hypothetical protein